MDKQAQDNKSNQQNPNHPSTGPGRSSGYSGAPSNLDNRANQMNPNQSGRK
ncbi:hypothetical protein DFA_04754 [Cavenderia fasciculata]|uniref:Uncharacterized protein n=1 Tax=Cavenderia fasciculata TaxID=261658 RepID=F4PQG1_CACFS|nr:uncharacterized protein DFA_04754 [Cavenderia fasciculata]EGG22624.1 hypothetical protein DFA_04754 [Cavenderia fasciculata]|eukprot:XP_004360475.1 hypothetical protein DFA_04754 [Cavenderia fasciculata]